MGSRARDRERAEQLRVDFSHAEKKPGFLE